VIDTPVGPLVDREDTLLRGWAPSADGSGLLDRLVPDGRLLRVEVAAPSPHSLPLTLALFDALDTDKNGVLTAAEATNAAKVLLARFDADGDDCLTALEIVPGLLTVVGQPTKPVTALAIQGPEADPVRVRVGTASRTIRDGFDVVSAVTGERPTVPKSLLRPGREKDRERFEGVAAEVVTLTVRPQARGWFEILDADGDGQLSIRELRRAWAVLAVGRALKAGEIHRRDLSEPPTTISATLAAGTRTPPPVRLARAPRPATGPEWFRALDRNGDGDVSRTEFIGTPAEFNSYDTDGDGLISAAEAEAGDRKRNPGAKP
jgi:hypothetical protein